MFLWSTICYNQGIVKNKKIDFWQLLMIEDVIALEESINVYVSHGTLLIRKATSSIQPFFLIFKWIVISMLSISKIERLNES